MNSDITCFQLDPYPVKYMQHTGKLYFQRQEQVYVVVIRFHSPQSHCCEARGAAAILRFLRRFGRVVAGLRSCLSFFFLAILRFLLDFCFLVTLPLLSQPFCPLLYDYLILPSRTRTNILSCLLSLVRLSHLALS